MDRFAGQVNAAVVQAGSCLFDTAGTLDKAQRLIRKAADQGAELIVLPEAFLGGYPKGMDFGVRVGQRSPEGRADFQRYFDSAVDVPGPETDALADLVRESGCHLVVGAVERAGSTLYCTALFFSPDGGLVGKHRKVMPTAAERVIWGMGDGSTLLAVPAGPALLGAAICWENYMPLLRAAMYAKGVTVWCAPTVDDRDSWQVTMRHIALEGRCFVLSACQYVARPAPDHQDEPAQPDLIRGGSVIVSPSGELLAGPHYGGEMILHAQLDLGEIVRGRFDLDVSGHYARPDIFQLLVNEQSRAAVLGVDGHL